MDISFLVFTVTDKTAMNIVIHILRGGLGISLGLLYLEISIDFIGNIFSWFYSEDYFFIQKILIKQLLLVVRKQW